MRQNGGETSLILGNDIIQMENYERYNRVYTYEEFSSWVENSHFIRRDLKKNSTLIDELPTHFMFDGHIINYDNIKYKLFYQNNSCVACGLVGSFFYKEKNGDSTDFHINMYGVKNGREVLFSKDHIMARRNGGTSILGNLQTMCVDCNNLKGHLSNAKFMRKMRNSKDSKDNVNVVYRAWPPVVKTLPDKVIPKMPMLPFKNKSQTVLKKCLTDAEKSGKVLCIDCKNFDLNKVKCNYEEVDKFDYVLGFKSIKYVDCYVENADGMCIYYKNKV